jgi:hypothetical protein
MQIVFLKNFKFFLLKINFFMYFGSFLCPNLKNNFKKIKKNNFNTFQYKKYFKK